MTAASQGATGTSTHQRFLNGAPGASVSIPRREAPMLLDSLIAEAQAVLKQLSPDYLPKAADMVDSTGKPQLHVWKRLQDNVQRTAAWGQQWVRNVEQAVTRLQRLNDLVYSGKTERVRLDDELEEDDSDQDKSAGNEHKGVADQVKFNHDFFPFSSTSSTSSPLPASPPASPSRSPPRASLITAEGAGVPAAESKLEKRLYTPSKSPPKVVPIPFHAQGAGVPAAESKLEKRLYTPSKSPPKVVPIPFHPVSAPLPNGETILMEPFQSNPFQKHMEEEIKTLSAIVSSGDKTTTGSFPSSSSNSSSLLNKHVDDDFSTRTSSNVIHAASPASPSRPPASPSPTDSSIRVVDSNKAKVLRDMMQTAPEQDGNGNGSRDMGRARPSPSPSPTRNHNHSIPSRSPVRLPLSAVASLSLSEQSHDHKKNDEQKESKRERNEKSKHRKKKEPKYDEHGNRLPHKHKKKQKRDQKSDKSMSPSLPVASTSPLGMSSSGMNLIPPGNMFDPK